MEICTEKLAYWYLRLNGFLTITNLVIHPDTGNRQETDVDIIGVRFPYRKENLVFPMTDDKFFTKEKNKSLIVIAEVKKGLCDLNGPWVRPERKNMLRVLKTVGLFPDKETEIAASSLYDSGVYSCQLYTVTLMCVGSRKNQNIESKYSQVPQVVWDDILIFIYNRFRKYRSQKQSHGQWDRSGQDLWNQAEISKTAEQFRDGITITDPRPICKETS